MATPNETNETNEPDAGDQRYPASHPDERHVPTVEDGAGRDRPYLRLGRIAWATLGIVGVLIVLGFVAGQVSLLVVPLVLALFPAALLMPVAKFFKRIGIPAALASILTIFGTIGLIVGLGWALSPIVANQAPELIDSVGEGLDQLESWLQDGPLELEFEGFAALLEEAQEQVTERGGEFAGGALATAVAVVEGFTALLLLLVALFFYLKDDGRLSRGVIRTLPEAARGHTREIFDRVWTTTGSYFRGQILVALVDAIFIGIGLVILGIPLALPLAVLVFFGGLFPIVGAVVTGSVAVLVALADAGIVPALLVAGLVLAVQQAESNILEPLILSKVIRLHPLVVLSSITAGAILLGILGAFLAVPVAASIARVVDYVRGEEGDAEAEADDESSGSDEESVTIVA
jgi:putative heme transporter